MSAIANRTAERYTTVSLKNLGDSVAGRIVAFEDYQPTDFNTKELKTFKDGSPWPGVRIHLEQEPGNEATRVTLYAEKINMLNAIGTAVAAAGASDIEVGGDLAVTFSGRDGQAHTFSAQYAKPE
jgi:hypothetical protein